ncbi:MAG TPA: hypothetical protein VGI86_14520, partial [Acidimicrobiia bacterium]
GPVRKQATDVAAMLGDPARCQVLLVTLPEETPVNELVDTAFAVEDRAGVALGPVIVNCCLPPEPELASIAAAPGAAVGGVGALGPDTASAVHDAAAFRVQRAEMQAAQLERLSARLPLPQIRLPFLFTATLGPDELQLLTDALVDGVAALA